MGLYEWRFRVSLAGSQAVAPAPVRQEQSVRARRQAASAWLSTLAHPWHAWGRLYSVVRTYCF